MISIVMKLLNVEFLRIFLLVKHLPFVKQYMAALLPSFPSLCTQVPILLELCSCVVRLYYCLMNVVYYY